MLFIDASRYNNTAKRTGVENYSFFLIKELIKQAPGEITLISPRKIDLDVPQITIPFPRLWTIMKLSLECLKNKKIDNLFIPSHVMPLIYPKNTAITIHDVAFKRYPKSYGFLSRTYLNFAAKFAVKHAKSIIVPSETTKEDLVKFYKCKSDKITVIPLGYEPTKKEGADFSLLKQYDLTPNQYFVYVGRVETKKNTDNLIKAFEIFAKSNTSHKLALVGFLGRGGEEILNNIPANIVNRIVNTNYVQDQVKHAIIQASSGFIFPSRYEGFGIPLLEAMDQRLPIIASNIPTSKAILQDNALYFDVENAAQLAEHMQTLVNPPDKVKAHINAYPEILKKYSWDAAGKQTLKVLKATNA